MLRGNLAEASFKKSSKNCQFQCMCCKFNGYLYKLTNRPLYPGLFLFDNWDSKVC